MATQSGISVTAANEPFTLVHNLPRPVAGRKQALVRSAYIGINPVDSFMHKTGMLVVDWPAVLGSDFCAQVIETGNDCQRLKRGDWVYGDAQLGQESFGPFQETFLVDEDCVFKKPDNLTPAQASTLGVALETATFGLSVGAKVVIPDAAHKAPPRDEWLVVLGGSGMVGHSAIQIARLCGYKVVASCSPSKNSIVKEYGADATFNNRASPEEQAQQVQAITAGKLSIVFDASAVSHEAAAKILDTTSILPKYFTTADPTPRTMPDGVTSYNVLIGKLGQSDDFGQHITTETKRMIPQLEPHVASGQLTAVDFKVYEKTGLDGLLAALNDYEKEVPQTKVVVRLDDD